MDTSHSGRGLLLSIFLSPAGFVEFGKLTERIDDTKTNLTEMKSNTKEHFNKIETKLDTLAAKEGLNKLNDKIDNTNKLLIELNAKSKK